MSQEFTRGKLYLAERQQWNADVRFIRTDHDKSGVVGLTGDNDGRLVVAAWNSYVKHFGERATECAEADMIGELREALRQCHDLLADSDVSYYISNNIGEQATLHRALNAARRVASKLTILESGAS
jgi:hypothetical protein